MRFLALLPLVAAAIASAQVWERPVAPGLSYRMEVGIAPPQVVHAFRLRANATAVSVMPELASPTVFVDDPDLGRAPLSAIVARVGGLAGINADFFPLSGDPLGAMVRAGEVISRPDPRRTVFAWGPGYARFGPLQWTARLRWGDEQLPISALNEETPDNALCLSTPTAGLALARAPSVHALIRLDPGASWGPSSRVEGTFEAFATDVPRQPVLPGTAVVSARGTMIPRLLRLSRGQRVVLEMELTGADWSLARHAIGGGPLLLRDGQRVIPWETEGFRDVLALRPHPRTALGRTATGDLWFVVVDGRQPMSLGVTLDELASIMSRLGCVDAMNLDGGGSSSLVAHGLVLNRPSDGVERKIANALVFRGPPVRTWDQPMVIAGPARVAADRPGTFRVLGPTGEPIDDVLVLWSASGAGWIDQSGTLRVSSSGTALVRAFVMGRVLTAEVQVEGPTAPPATPPAAPPRGAPPAGARSGRR